MHAGLQFIGPWPALGGAVERLAEEVVFDALEAAPVAVILSEADRQLAALRPPTARPRRTLGPELALECAPTSDANSPSLTFDELIAQAAGPEGAPFFADVTHDEGDPLERVTIRRWIGDQRIIFLKGDLPLLVSSERVRPGGVNEWWIDTRGASVRIPLGPSAVPRLELTDGRVELVIADEDGP